MYNLIPPIIIILSIGGILVIFLKKITKVSKEIGNEVYQNEPSENNSPNISPVSDIERAVHMYGEENTDRQVTFLERVKTRLNTGARMRKMQYSLFQSLEKTLRRVKVNLMKIENVATHLTKRISEKTKTFHLPRNENTRNEEPDSIVQETRATEYKEREESIITRVRKRKVEIEEVNTEIIEEKEEIMEIQERVVIEESVPEKPILRKIIQEKPERVQKVKPEQEREFVELEKEFIYRIAKNPNDIESYLALGSLYLSVGNYDDAEQSFRHALKINPGSRKAKKGLREIEQRGNDDDLWG